ncbi:hypothetical protein KKA53_04665 [Candidatus Dependentiae bacterium]|nr:hypothetical protein [Candidatus Dependentiae bacterium]
MKKVFVFALSAMFCLPVCRADLSINQKAHLGVSALKTAILLYVDTVNPESVSMAKLAAKLRLFARVLNGASKGFDYRDGIRDTVSLGSHLNASVWEGIKDIEELRVLTRLDKEYEDGVSVSELKKYYNGFEEFDEEFDGFDFDAGEELTLKKIMKPLLRVAELGLSAGITCRAGTPKQRNLMMIGQSLCDSLLRFVCRKHSFISPSVIGKIEAVSSIVPGLYDAGRAGYDFFRKGQESESVADPESKNEGKICELCCGNDKDFFFPCCGHPLCQTCYNRIIKTGINVGGCFIYDCVPCPWCRRAHKEIGDGNGEVDIFEQLPVKYAGMEIEGETIYFSEQIDYQKVSPPEEEEI